MTSTWDYAGMEACAKKLDTLREASNANKGVMDKAFETLIAGMNAETGRAFMAAYSENVSSIQLFAQVLDSEAKLLRSNAEAMQTTDEIIAQEIRITFGV